LRELIHRLSRTAFAVAAAMACAAPAQAQLASLNFKGFNYVSYYNGGYANADSMPALVTTGANAVALAFEYGIDVDNSTVYADSNYTEASSVIASTIAEANSRGLNVMVRPLIDFLAPSKIGSYSVGDWRSTYNPTNVATFFASYKSMIVSVAQLAQTNGAASLSIGVELDQLTGPAYQSYWTDIITAVRAVFSGKLTYSSEWDDNQSPWQGSHGLPAGTGDLTTQVSFWSQLDYLGIDAYPPISGAASPTVSQLVAGWTQVPTVASTLSTTGNQSLISYFASVATATGLPLIFTELGYESATDAASQPFGSSTNSYDASLQSNLYAAFFEAWRQSGNNTLTGVYFWNWDPNAAEVGPGNGANFSPQGEPAQAVVTANFGGTTPALQVSPAGDIAATGLQGGPFTPSSFAFQFQATSGSVTYTVSGMPSWLTASSTSGTVTTAATTVTLSTNTNANTLSPGNYSATIIFTDTTNSDVILALSAVLSVSQSPYTLAVSVTGSGMVTSSPSGISCGATCSAGFATGTQVVLDATPAAGASFTGWGGACSGTGSCQVTMNAATSVTANFTQTDELLTVNVSGNGAVTSNPSGVSCPADCSAVFAGASVVTLTAAPGAGGSFSGWGGACGGTATTCNVTMSSAEGVTAIFAPSAGGAPASVTFVSALLGNDANPCTRDSPCLTFAGAYANTTAGGEIDVLDPGDYGPLTITQSLRIANGAAGVAGAAVSGMSAITITTGASDYVNLKGLTLDGGNASNDGLLITSGSRVGIQNCVIQNFSNAGTSGLAGINIAPSSGRADVTIQNATLLHNNVGVFIKPATGATANVVIEHSRIDNNTAGGVRSDGTGGGSIVTTVSDSSIGENGTNGVNALSGPGSATVNLIRDTINANAETGIVANQNAGGAATVAVGASLIAGNVTGVQSLGGGEILTASNNQLLGNGSNGSFTGTAPLQ
jgi:hypothetical protein